MQSLSISNSPTSFHSFYPKRSFHISISSMFQLIFRNHVSEWVVLCMCSCALGGANTLHMMHMVGAGTLLAFMSPVGIIFEFLLLFWLLWLCSQRVPLFGPYYSVSGLLHFLFSSQSMRAYMYHSLDCSSRLIWLRSLRSMTGEAVGPALLMGSEEFALSAQFKLEIWYGIYMVRFPTLLACFDVSF